VATQIDRHISIQADDAGDLGPFTPGYHAKRRYSTQNKPKRNNSLVHRLLVRDQGVGGSNPLSSNKSLLINKMRSMFSLAATALDVSERSMESVASASGEHLVELAVGPGLPCFGCCDS